MSRDSPERNSQSFLLRAAATSVTVVEAASHAVVLWQPAAIADVASSASQPTQKENNVSQ
jgi:hypothetical protein